MDRSAGAHARAASAAAAGRSGAFSAVVMTPTAATGELRLETEIVRLQHEFAARPSRVRFTLRAYLVDDKTRRVLAWREFDAAAPAASETPRRRDGGQPRRAGRPRGARDFLRRGQTGRRPLITLSRIITTAITSRTWMNPPRCRRRRAQEPQDEEYTAIV